MLSRVSFLLLKLPPELAHSIAVFFLKSYQLFKKHLSCPIEVKQILIKVAPNHELKFLSRLGLAAGFDKNAEVFPALFHLGFGFVEMGTVTPLPQPGNPRPRIWRVAPNALVNHMGFNSIGLRAFKRNVERHRPQVQAPIFANIGKNKETPLDKAGDDYKQCIEELRSLVEGFVINISSPNTPGLRDLQSVSFLKALVPILPEDKPNFIKLAPDLTHSEFEELCLFVSETANVSGVVLTNTSRLISKERGFAQGGFSGPPLLSISLAWIERAHRIFKGKKTIIGVGGVSSAGDALRMREAGADLVEIYTSFVYQGPKIVREITKAL